jgi:hypothetical protein
MSKGLSTRTESNSEPDEPRDLPERTLGDYEGRVWVAKRIQREEARMTEIIADVMTRGPATVERRESTH